MQKVNYGNWVPEKMLVLYWIISVLFGVLFTAGCVFAWKFPVVLFTGILFFLMLASALYMQLCHHIFSFTGGKLMAKVHDYLLEKMEWDGSGTLIDIGCGSGAVTIKCAKKYPAARITGIDYWGKTWNYAKEQCERNAEAEGVKDRISFIKGDAAVLPFPDGTFDAAVSNFVFHEVMSQSDKRLVVHEALRVVKKGGRFAFHDLFEHKELYGDMHEFVEELRTEGYTEIAYEPHTEKLAVIPDIVKAPWMLSGLGLLYGRK
ncbi:MAG TPA: class I SAM-dependent methyltransferase [Treponema sp.]|nr:class I SAM-dependent methyltransferase [Treponema sp.]